MTADELNDTQRRLLAALACYRLLNVQQMLLLGVAGSEASIRLEARVLERKKLIGANDWHLVPSVRTLPRLHWLTDRGAAVLATGGENDPLGARREMGSEGHIMHRIKTVDAHIALRLWAASAGVAVHWFVTDFEPGSGGLRKPTTIKYDGKHGQRYTPDALGDVLGPDGRSRLLVLEIERGRGAGTRLADFRAKLAQLREVSERYVVEEWAGRPKHRARFLIVFATAALRDKHLTTWPDPGATAWRNFFVKCDDELGHFNTGWWRPGGRSRRPLFSWNTSAQPTATTPLPAV